MINISLTYSFDALKLIFLKLFFLILILLSPLSIALEYFSQDDANNLSSYIIKNKIIQYKIIEKKEHTLNTFTQGFVYSDSFFYESSGLYGKSFIIKYDENNTVIAKKKLPDFVFIEGITVTDKFLIALTWKAGIVYFLDKITLKTIKKKRIKGQGWGITHSDNAIIISNGSNILQFKDKNTFKDLQKLTIKDDTVTISKINELEYINGFIWANIWQSNHLIKIDPNTGQVVGKVLLDNIVQNHPPSARNSYDDVLNGIAYDKRRNGLWVTGKKWNVRYFIQLTDKTLK